MAGERQDPRALVDPGAGVDAAADEVPSPADGDDLVESRERVGHVRG